MSARWSDASRADATTSPARGMAGRVGPYHTKPASGRLSTGHPGRWTVLVHRGVDLRSRLGTLFGMPALPHRPAELAWEVFRGSDVIRRGLLTRHQLRGASWVRLRHDVYADARLDRDHGLACRAALLRLPVGALIAGPSAAYLHGVEHAAGFQDDVHVLLPRTARVDSQPGIRVHLVGPEATSRGDCARPTPAGEPSTRPTAGRTASAGPRRNRATRPSPSAPPSQPVPGPVRAGMPRTDPAQCAWETAVWSESVRAVGIVDTLLATGLTSDAALADVLARNAGRPGGRRASWIFGLADPGAQSPPESHLRVRLVLAGLPRPVTQHPVRLAAGLVLHPDLAWPEFRVAVEYDGQWHADVDRFHRDRQRLNQLVTAGWLVLHVTGRRLYRDFTAVEREVRAALASRGWRRT